MSSLRWKLLMAYLPGMATVVNSFQSPDVQKHVFDTLLQALDEKTLAEDGVAVVGVAPEVARKRPEKPKAKPADGKSKGASSESAVDLVDGASIHAYLSQATAAP